MSYLLLAIGLLLAGFVVMGATMLNLSLVYPILLAVSILGSGLMPLGYSLVDEVLAGFVLVGAILGVWRRRGAPATAQDDRLAQIHLILFLAMAAYFEFQAVRGLIVLESWRKIRWVAFFPVVGLIPAVLRMTPAARPSGSAVAATVTVSTLAYFALYLLHGLGAELLGVSRWSLQGTWWGPTAYASLPVVIAMPAVLYCLRQGRRWLRASGWGTLAIIIVSAFYFDSRVAMLSVIAFLAVGARTFGPRAIAAAVLLIAAAVLLISPLVSPRYADPRQLAGELVKTIVTFVRPPERFVPRRDMERYIHVQVAFTALGKDWRSTVFGYGFRTHGRVISPELKAAYERYGAPEIAARIRDDESTVGVTALAVDTGLLGVGLFLAVHVLVAVQVWAGRQRRYRFSALLAVVLLFFWQVAVNTLDAVLVYVLLMPGGPLQLLAGGGGSAAAEG